MGFPLSLGSDDTLQVSYGRTCSIPGRRTYGWVPLVFSFSFTFLVRREVSSEPCVLRSSLGGYSEVSGKFSYIHSAGIPFESDVVARFFFAVISMSRTSVVPGGIAVLAVGGAVLSEVVPIAITDMGFGGSFVVLVIFLDRLVVGLAGVGG